MEAILGAVAEDGGDEALRAVMSKLGFAWRHGMKSIHLGS